MVACTAMTRTVSVQTAAARAETARAAVARAAAVPDDIDEDDCDGVMVRHRDGARECLEPGCAGADLPHGPLDVPCHAVFEDDCPRCGLLIAR
ncbi:MAG: hypothetical protein ACRDYZ_12995 [Acidimicrobiales bacterium]